jgi:hypothetical protein
MKTSFSNHVLLIKLHISYAFKRDPFSVKQSVRIHRFLPIPENICLAFLTKIAVNLSQKRTNRKIHFQEQVDKWSYLPGQISALLAPHD